MLNFLFSVPFWKKKLLQFLGKGICQAPGAISVCREGGMIDPVAWGTDMSEASVLFKEFMVQ